MYSLFIIYIFLDHLQFALTIYIYSHSQSQTHSVSTGPKHTRTVVSLGNTPPHTNPQPPTRSIHPVHSSTSPHAGSGTHKNTRPPWTQLTPSSGTDSATTGLWHTQAGGNQTRSHPLHVQKEAGRITQPEVLMSRVTHSYKQTLLNGGGSCVDGPFRHLTSVEFSVQMCCWLTSIWAVLIFEGLKEANVVQMCWDGSDMPLEDSEGPWTALHAQSLNHECHPSTPPICLKLLHHCKTWVDIWNKW